MSSQSAQYRTTHHTVAGNAPVSLEDVKVKDEGSRSEAERASVAWIPVLLIFGWLELCYIVPALADWTAQILDGHL